MKYLYLLFIILLFSCDDSSPVIKKIVEEPPVTENADNSLRKLRVSDTFGYSLSVETTIQADTNSRIFDEIIQSVNEIDNDLIFTSQINGEQVIQMSDENTYSINSLPFIDYFFSDLFPNIPSEIILNYPFTSQNCEIADWDCRVEELSTDQYLITYSAGLPTREEYQIELVFELQNGITTYTYSYTRSFTTPEQYLIVNINRDS